MTIAERRDADLPWMSSARHIPFAISGAAAPHSAEFVRTFMESGVSILRADTGRSLIWLRNLAREPLLHFLAIGAVIFAVNALIAPPAGKDRLIEVTPEVRQSIVELFRTERHRDPTSEEMAPLIEVWLLNEITYREALAQGLDRGDEMIRERIMQKMRLLIFGNVNITDPTEPELQQWLDSHRRRYDIPPSISFFEVPVPGPDGAAEAAELLRQIQRGEEPEAVRLRARAFAKRPYATLVNGFGQEFIDRLSSFPRGQWQALQSGQDWHIVRLDENFPGRQVDLNEVRDQVFTDAKQDRVRTAATGTIREMGKAYTIRGTGRP
jgi:hypothetical protein